MSGSQTLGGFSPLTNASRFYIYNNTNINPYESVLPTTTFATGIGYLIRMPNEDPSIPGGASPYALGTAAITYNGVFTGTPNNGDVSIGVTAGAYNAIGNPYPSAINADQFMTGNAINTLYFWRKKNNNTVTPTTNGNNGLIPSYTITDLTATYKFSKGLNFKAGINNLFDERYFSRRAGGYPGPGALPGDGRTFFVNVGAKF